jgi:hypothetical protein
VTGKQNLMSQFSQIKLAFKAIYQLGPSYVSLFALYQLGLKTGHYERVLTSSLKNLESLYPDVYTGLSPCLPGLPDRKILSERMGSQVDQLYEEADEIVMGNFRCFGGQPIPLELTLPQPLENWDKYEKGNKLSQDKDIKFIWEPGRFGWACKLAMAYHLSADERYAESFWRFTEQFLLSNPPFLGQHWSSAQEVSIRLIALTFALQLLTPSIHTTSDRLEKIAKTIAFHAERIPATLVYARSQNNNHLITEALGLYTASAILPKHPLALKWHTLGWKWLIYAFQAQISIDGTYTQHSTNYHRLMLQAAIWARLVHDHSFTDEPIPSVLTSRLEAATYWLWKMVDPGTGRVPNLGHNDGAYLLPLTICPYHDFRPVIHTASRLFLRTQLNPSGIWDDMAAWLCLPSKQLENKAYLDFWQLKPRQDESENQSQYRLVNHNNNSWAVMRVAKYHSRPAHADQLHLDLWWRGCNIAQDAGTYLYNSPPTWENSLTNASVHNTVVLDGQEFMSRAGRFLYLDWAQARVLELQSSPGNDHESITAAHNGYRKIGVIHSRKVSIKPDNHWEVIDHLEGPSDTVHTARLHWLLPDWDYVIQEPLNTSESQGIEVHIKSPHGWICLKMEAFDTIENRSSMRTMNFQLVRAGMILVGSGTALPISGWTSPTYGEKIPALSCSIELSQALPIEFKSEWFFPDES